MGDTNQPAKARESLEGCIERVVFHAPESGFSVMHLRCGTRKVTCVGSVAQPKSGENLRVFGEWVTDAKYGRQFRFESYQLIRPSSTEALISYLASGKVEGIGTNKLPLLRSITGHMRMFANLYTSTCLSNRGTCTTQNRCSCFAPKRKGRPDWGAPCAFLTSRGLSGSGDRWDSTRRRSAGQCRGRGPRTWSSDPT